MDENPKNMKMAENTEEDGVFDVTEDDLAELKAALYRGLQELERFLSEREDSQNDGKHKAFEGQGINR